MATTLRIDPRIYNDVYRPYLTPQKRIEIMYGGAGSGKSVFIAQKKVAESLTLEDQKTLVLRKVQKTVRHSCFAEIKSVISDWGVRSLYKIKDFSMEIERIGTNSSIIFAGLDDVEKMKSIVGVTSVWMEEATEFTKEDFMQVNLRVRKPTPFQKQLTLTFNPVSALSWLKPFFFDNPRKDTTILKTTYQDNKFLDAEYREQIEDLKNQDPIYYQIYALGNWGVLGNLVYTNYKVEKFDVEMFGEDETYQGIDWGFNDPSVALQIGFRDKLIFIRDGLYLTGHTNPEFMEKAEKVLDKRLTTIADSSEPARVKEFRQAGWKIRGSHKFVGSVRFGIDFCRRHQVIIHPSMVDYLSEKQSYCYRTDKDNNVLEDPIDFKNHYMDAERYALEPLMKDRRFTFA